MFPLQPSGRGRQLAESGSLGARGVILFDLEGAPMDPEAVAGEPLPAIPGFPFLHAGVGALISGPTGGGRSSLVQACAYDAALAGVRVAYLGSEVTQGEFNARAADLAARRGDPVTDDLRGDLASVRYLNLPSVLAPAWSAPDAWVEAVAARFDVVLIDPLSAVASTLDLDFDKSNAEFVRFYDRLVQPLAAADVAVVLLENIGHAVEARGRAKGASAKQDRADLTFSCKLRAQPVGLVITAGKVRSVRAPWQRGDSWTFHRDTQRIERTEADPAGLGEAVRFRPTVLMERVSRALEATPGLTRRALRDTVKGKNETVLVALDVLIAEGYIEQQQEGQHPTHRSKRSYCANDDAGPRGPLTVPDWSRGPWKGPVPRSPQLRTGDRGPHPPDRPPIPTRRRGHSNASRRSHDPSARLLQAPDGAGLDLRRP